MLLTPKQIEFVRNANHRWNFKGGATRSGKTYLDFRWVIPMRIRERAGKEGLTVILGVTKSTIERNILEPMRQIYGPDFVSNISSDNTVRLFGEKCYALGAEKITQVSKLRGASFKYTYGDEVADWAPDVFDLVKSRLDKGYSCFDGTYNPQGPRHWLKQFLDSDADIFSQSYNIDDNPFLDPIFVENLKKEYAGTVYYNRYILGLWAAAEGACFPLFAAAPDRYIIYMAPPIMYANIGVDFGGGTSGHAFQCVGFTHRYSEMVVLEEYFNQAALDPQTLEDEFVGFVRMCQRKYIIANVYCDSAEQTLINGLRNAAARAGLRVNIFDAQKKHINDRIRAACKLQGADRFKIMAHCTTTIDAYASAVYDGKNLTADVRLDNGTSNVDTLDASEYAYEREIYDLCDAR
jgi:PBSX family phage terminase large subunit